MLTECNKRLVQNAQDRISSLLDELLIQILSNLPTKEAVRNGILSKRWVSLWTFMPTLVLDCETDFKGDADSRDMFYEFVDNTLVDRKMPHLRYVNVNAPKKNTRNLESWILAAKERNITNLELSGSSSVVVLGLPQSLISGWTIVEFRLKIRAVLDIPIASTSCFPNLKVLCLSSVKFKNDDSATNLISSCPVLQDLEMRSYKGKCFRTLNLTSHSLKAFSLFYTGQSFDIEHKLRIFIDAPAMESIHIDVDETHSYKMKEFSNLSEVDIDIYTFWSSFSKDYIARRALQLLNHTSNTKSLRISSSTLESLQDRYFYRRLPEFCNLTSLEFSKSGTYNWEWKVLMEFLECCPVLKVLMFKGFTIHKSDKYEDGQNDVPSCLTYHLKTIKVCQMWMEYHENQVMKLNYFLDNCRVLEKMILEGFKAEELSTLPRSSPTCHIEIR